MRTIRHLALLFLTIGANAQNGLWAELQFPTAPSARYGSLLVHDTARDRLVLVGGLPGGSNETWEHDGAQWVLRTTSGPVGSAIWYPGAALAGSYDTARQRLVVLQCDASTGNSKTWEWNGTGWQLRTNSSVPPGRSAFALAYDSTRSRTVLFGGNSNFTGHLSDTWEWDGTTWTQRGSGGPSPRVGHQMTFDSARGRIVLFGGYVEGQSNQTLADTWEWNGTYWFEYFGITNPPARRNGAMTFDSHRNVTVLYGGRNNFGTLTDTWEWNGTQWTNRLATNPANAYAAMAYDSIRRRTMLFGGWGASGQGSNQTFAYAVTNHVASITPFGAGCLGPNGVPTLSVQSGLPRLGSTLTMQLGNLPTSPLNLPIGWLGYSNTAWNGVPLPLSLDPLGFTGCTALIAPEQAFAFSNVAGAATWSIWIPFLPAFAGLQFYLQGGVLALGFNPGGIVFTRALAGVVGQ
jgi:Galactose oxidase, central domain